MALTHLCIGHCQRLRNFFLDGGSVPLCAHCDSLLTVEPHFGVLHKIY